jgi:hypothetical protein
MGWQRSGLNFGNSSIVSQSLGINFIGFGNQVGAGFGIENQI